MNEPPTSEDEVTRPDGEPPRQPVAVSPSDWWGRVKEHKVLQWGLAYLGAALAFAHGGDLLGHAFHWPEALNRLLLGILIVGFPVALALAWYHGHRSLKTVTTGEATIISILLIIGAGLLVLFVRPSSEETVTVAQSTTPVVSSTPTRPALPAADSGPSIAVLPFVNMSSEREQEYFSDGLSEELLNELTRLPNLRVIGRTSSFAFKGKNEDLRTIGETLGVDHILEGSVRKSGEYLRITAQLINPADGSHLWSDTYDRKIGDVFKIQEEIARTVASSLRISIELTNLHEGGTHNLEAYDAYLRALYVSSPAAAIPHLERAVELDPGFTQALNSLIGAYGGAILFSPLRNAEWIRKRQEAEIRLLALAPESANAKAVLADRAIDAGRLLEGEQLLQSAHNSGGGAAADIGRSYGIFLLSVGRPRDSLELFRASQQADPLSIFPQSMVLINYEVLGEMKEAEEAYHHWIALQPNNEELLASAGLRAMALGNPVAVRAAFASTIPAPPPIPAIEHPTETGQINATMVALLDKAPAALAQLHRWAPDASAAPQPFLLMVEADWAAYFGDPDLSLQLLRRVPLQGTNARASLMFTLWRPVEKGVRRLPQFKEFVRELGLPDYWRASGNWGDFCHPIGQSDFACN